VIAATYLRGGGAVEVGGQLTRLFEASGNTLAGCVSTAQVALGWSRSALVNFPRCEPGLVSLSLGSVDSAMILRRPIFESSLGLRDPVALFAAADRGLILARGPFGGRPVYYAVLDDGSSVIACSDLLPIVRQLSATIQVDVEGLAAQIVDCIGPDPARTPYRSIRRLDTCEVLRVGPEGQRSSIEIPPEPALKKATAEELAAEFREILVDAIAREARGLSRASIMTGGGLDSSGLLAAAELGYRKGRHDCRFGVVAMDVAGPGDDRPHLRALCLAMGIDPVRVSTNDAVALAPSVLIADGAPFTFPTAPMATAAFRSAGAAGAEAVFTGSGGDAMTFGDLSLFSDRVLGRRLLPALWSAARLRTMGSSSARTRMFDLVLRPLARRLAPRSWLKRRRARALRKTLRWKWAGPHLRSFLLAVGCEEPEADENWYSDVARSRILGRENDLRGQYEWASQLSERCPYLDARLVEFVASVPKEARIYRHDDRGLFREAMRGLLPESVRTRPDKASFEPVINEIASSVYASGALSRFARMEALGDLRLVDPPAFRSALAKACAESDGRAWFHAWPALCAEAFLLHGWTRIGDAPPARGSVH
jgi:asparagine synthase (glutamine-hydrolysing)